MAAILFPPQFVEKFLMERQQHYFCIWRSPQDARTKDIIGCFFIGIKKSCDLTIIYLKFVQSLNFVSQWASINFGISLVPNRRQVIAWTNENPVPDAEKRGKYFHLMTS